MVFRKKQPLKQSVGEKAVDAVNKLLNGGLLATYGAQNDTNIAQKVKALNTVLANWPDSDDLEDKLEAMPFYLRGHIERALYVVLKKETPAFIVGNVKNPAVKGKAEASTDKPFIYHMAGTGVDKTHPGDTLAHAVREHQSFEIIAGTKDTAFGGGGRKKVRQIIADLEKLGDKRPKHIILTGFSRGAAVQIGLANAIHEKFNKDKQKEDWITIDMFLVDPTLGVADMNRRAGTRHTQVAPCVNTLNIACADDKRASNMALRFASKREDVHLDFDPAHTTVQTITLKGRHNDLGLFNRSDVNARHTAYFVEATFREFLKASGCERNEQTALPEIDVEHAKEYAVSGKQRLSSAYAARLKHGDTSENTNLAFSCMLPKYFADSNNYRDVLLGIRRNILEGKYNTYMGGEKHEDKKKGRLPRTMHAICKLIDNRINSSYMSHAETLGMIQVLAQKATKETSWLKRATRAPLVNKFYQTLAGMRVPKEEAVSAESSKPRVSP